MFVVEIFHASHILQILTYQGAQNACASAMQYSHPAYTYQYSIINEIGHCLYGLVTPHATHIDVLLKVQLAVVHRILRLFT